MNITTEPHYVTTEPHYITTEPHYVWTKYERYAELYALA